MSADTPQHAGADQEKLVIFSDYVCPFCYLGKASLETYLSESGKDVEIDWRPFDLQAHKRGPDGDIRSGVSDGKSEAYFERAKQNVRRLQDEYDVEMTLELSRDIDSWRAHKAALWVEQSADADQFEAFNNAIFDALWRDARDIGDPDVLADLAEEVGLDGDAVRHAAESDDLDDALREAIDESQQVGIRGVPAFFYDGRGTQGAVPPEHFEELLG
jgi:predicted DsbA family dithiol-disulfide isomerase